MQPDWTIHLLTAEVVGELAAVDVDFLAVHIGLATWWSLRAADAGGKDVYVWTVNDPLHMSRMVTRGGRWRHHRRARSGEKSARGTREDELTPAPPARRGLLAWSNSQRAAAPERRPLRTGISRWALSDSWSLSSGCASAIPSRRAGKLQRVTVKLYPAEFHGEWNYTIKPQQVPAQPDPRVHEKNIVG